MALVVACGLAASCTGGQGNLAVASSAPEESTTAVRAPTSAPTTAEPTTTTTEPTTTTTTDPALDALAAMSLEQKVGQLLMPVIVGTQVDDSGSASSPSPGDLVAFAHVGGVIYLGSNITDAEQLTALSQGLQERALADSGIGLLVAVDQEGGRVVRIRDAVTVLPAARSLGGDTEMAATGAAESGAQLRLQGINMVLAPVADVTDSTTNVIGNRAYSSDPAVVSAMVSAVIGGYQSAGLAAVAKHWPGHGSTEVDSHQSLPTLGITLDQWMTVDRAPFEAAIGAGVDAVMVGHLAFPAIDPSGDPATISAPLVQEQLRNVLGFDGVVMTDALDMGAVEDLGAGALAVRSVAAGVDLLLAPADVGEAASALLTAVEDGTLTEERIDTSVLRLLRLKARLGLPIGPRADPPAEGAPITSDAPAATAVPTTAAPTTAAPTTAAPTTAAPTTAVATTAATATTAGDS